MGYILCKGPEAERPYYVKELSINLYSAYELCYFIYNHSALLGDDFPDEEMLTFIGTGCHMPELERKLRKWKLEGEDAEVLLLAILQDVGYYGERELRGFQERMGRRRTLPLSEKMKQKGDYMLKNRYYMVAISIYDQILRGEFGNPKDQLVGRVKYNRAIALAGLFQFNEAADEFADAYFILKEPEILRDLCFVYEIDHSVPLREDLIDIIPARSRQRWKEEYSELRLRAANEGKALETKAVFEKGAFAKKEAAVRLAEEWKTEYRRLFK